MRSSRRGELRAVAPRRRVARPPPPAHLHADAGRVPAAAAQRGVLAHALVPERARSPSASRAPARSGLGGARVVFEGDPVVFQWYPGQGLQIQPLANFGKANALWRACQPPPVGTGAGADPDAHADARSDDDARPTSDPREGRRPRSPRRTPTATPAPPATPRPAAPRSCARCSTAWSPSPPSAAASPRGSTSSRSAAARRRGSAASRRGRRSRRSRAGRQQLSDPRYLAVARRALGAFERRPPIGVRAPSASGSGRHYLIYSFATGLRVLNGFLQSLVGLHDLADATGDRRARRLFRDGDRAAKREIPRYDTGRLVALRRGRQRVRPRLPPARARLPDVAVRAHPGERVLRARQALRPLPARAHPRRLRRRRRRARSAARRASASRSPSSPA